MAITTVGYDETIPLYKAGRIFTILLVAGCITYVFVITCIIQFSMGEKMSF